MGYSPRILLPAFRKCNRLSFARFSAQKSIASKGRMKFIELSNGSQMPIVGLGTWRASPEEVEKAVLTALDVGYTHIDTAYNYNNEEAIGKSIKHWLESGRGKREDLFITTKLPHFGNRPSDVEKFLKLSLQKLQLEYVDLYLIHMPFTFKCNEEDSAPIKNEDGSFCLDTGIDIIATWTKMEDQVRKGSVRSIGLSNFNIEQIKRISERSVIKPAVLQVELHAYFQQRDLVKFCRDMNIAVTAYSPLGSPGANLHFSSKYNYSLEDFPDVLGNPTVLNLVDKYNKSPGQILLKHLIQQDIIVIPKSSNTERIKSNIDLFDFELSAEDLEKLNNLDKGEKGRIFDFLFLKGVDLHPEYPFSLKETLHLD